jgi:uncharacterized membrane protein
MNKTRLEAFSDGVFAIVITLLILNIRLPDVKYDELPSALRDVVPSILAYVMSFAIIGLYWISHHQSFQYIAKVDRSFLWMNILLLLFISFIPFPTSLLGKYPFKEIPVLIYGLNLLVANATGFGMLMYINYHPELATEEFTKAVFRKLVTTYAIVNLLYVMGIGLSFYAPLASFIIYIFVLLVLIFLYRDKHKM